VLSWNEGRAIGSDHPADLPAIIRISPGYCTSNLPFRWCPTVFIFHTWWSWCLENILSTHTSLLFFTLYMCKFCIPDLFETSLVVCFVHGYISYVQLLLPFLLLSLILQCTVLWESLFSWWKFLRFTWSQVCEIILADFSFFFWHTCTI
jgi:hypothetical protein